MVGFGQLTELIGHTRAAKKSLGRLTHDGNATFRLILLRSADFTSPARRDTESRDEIVRCSRELQGMLAGRPGVLLGDVTYHSRRVAETVAVLSTALQRTAVTTGQSVCLEEVVREGRPALVDMVQKYEQHGYDLVVVTHLLIIHMLAHEAGVPLLPRWNGEALSPAEPVMFRIKLRDGDLEQLAYEPDPLGSQS